MYFVLLPFQYRSAFPLSVLWFAAMIFRQLFVWKSIPQIYAMYITCSSGTFEKNKFFHIPPPRSLTGLLFLQLEDAKETRIIFQKQALRSSIQQAISTLSNFSELLKKILKEHLAWYSVKVQSLISFPFSSEHHFYTYVHFEISTTGWQLSMLFWARRLLPPFFNRLLLLTLSCWR